MYQKRKYIRTKPIGEVMETQRKLSKEDIEWVLNNVTKITRREMAEKLGCSTKTLDRVVCGLSYKDVVAEIIAKKSDSFDVV